MTQTFTYLIVGLYIPIPTQRFEHANNVHGKDTFSFKTSIMNPD